MAEMGTTERKVCSCRTWRGNCLRNAGHISACTADPCEAVAWDTREAAKVEAAMDELLVELAELLVPRH